MHLGYIAVREHYGRVGKLIKEHHEKRKPRPEQNILHGAELRVATKLV